MAYIGVSGMSVGRDYKRRYSVEPKQSEEGAAMAATAIISFIVGLMTLAIMDMALTNLAGM